MAPRSTTTFSMVLLAVAICFASSFAPTATTKQSSSALSMARRGRGKSLGRELGDSSSSSSAGGMGGAGMGQSTAGGINWLNTNKSVKELPKESGEIKLIETGAFLLVDKGTNPNGAAATAKYGNDVFCFQANCPQCKVPMTKSKVLEPNDETNANEPRISCDLCKCIYNLKTGAKLESEENPGFLGGIANAVLGAKDEGDMEIYKLGEKDGKIMFNMKGM